MERLTKKDKIKLSHGEEIINCKHDAEDCNESCMETIWCKWLNKALEKLKEYEDLEEQNRLLKLPCKAGQKVYLLRKDIKNVIEGEITSINISEFSMGMRIFIIDDNRYTDASFDKIGEILFFTQKEAEAALKELENSK